MAFKCKRRFSGRDTLAVVADAQQAAPSFAYFDANLRGPRIDTVLYQLFDYYLRPAPDVWVAVDLKNWTRNTDSLKKLQLQEAAEKKHAKLRELLPEATVHTLYVNLQGAHKFAVTRPPQGTIRFMAMYVQNTGEAGWMPNANLRDAILGK